MWQSGLVAHVASRRPAILTILQNCAVISVACCVFYSHCGNRAIMRQRPLEQRNSSWFVFWKEEERNTWLAKFLRINELKDQVCSSWFAPVGSASDYPLFSKWVIYGELACSGSCSEYSDGISPIYSLWATFIGLYMADYIVERSTGWTLTHPLPVEEYEKLKKKKQLKPDFLDMVPWKSLMDSELLYLIKKTGFLRSEQFNLFIELFQLEQDVFTSSCLIHCDLVNCETVWKTQVWGHDCSRNVDIVCSCIDCSLTFGCF